MWIYGLGGPEIGESSYYMEHGDVNANYWIFFYVSVIMIKGNEMGPRTNSEIIWFTVILLIDLIVAGNIFGSVASLV